ncbi:MAG: F-type H+-transporting ATPase subunit epsilon [Paracoccaceae bacterium]|jgi:F-type H+-transporting ATPase subunit epsilon
MAALMQFNLVSPERRVASLQATEVQIPATDGDMTAMADHSPLITTLRPGVLTVISPDGETKYAVTGGFAEITAEGTSVLAEQAMLLSDLTADMFKVMSDEAEQAKTSASPEQTDVAAKYAADIAVLGQQVGL